jgi:hypothetical protein
MNKINNIKALIFDLDGTLLSSKKSIAPKTLDCLLSLKKQGMKIIIATGRTPLACMHKLVQLNLSTPMVCANGACIYDPLANAPMEEVLLTPSSIERFLKIANDTNKHAILYSLDHTYLPQEIINKYINLSGSKESKKVLDSILPIDTFKIGEELIYKCIIHSKNIGYDKEFLKNIKNNIADLDQDIFITYAHPDFLEFVDKSVNKYASLSGVLKSLNIEDDEVIAFGDGVNDLEMLGKFSYSVAMGNASDEVKEVAAFTTDSNDEEGIYKFLKMNYLI